MNEFAVFISLAQQLVEGVEPSRLEPQVPAEFREAWVAILHGIERKGN